MALKTKAKIASIGEALGKKSKEFTFIDPPMIDAPNTQILNLDGSPRQLPDPSKTLKPAMGVERIMINATAKVESEKGPNGESVLEIASKDPRIRFVGSDWITKSNAAGTHQNNNSDEDPNQFVEVTFYGTGLNALAIAAAGTVTLDIDVDGSPSGTVVLGAKSIVIQGRNYKSNSVFSIASGLSLGTHTIRIKGKVGNTESMNYFGFEILNEDTQIQVPQGEVFAAGNKFSNAALAAIDYNTGFEGSPTLNGRGGRVSVYMTPEGQFKKAIQQTDASQLNMTSADHSNEEVIRKINWREFGANRADDFSTLSTSNSDRAFTLDDGTTTLVGNDCRQFSNTYLQPNTASAFFTLTFIGTGLDFVDRFFAATLITFNVYVDGILISQVDNSGGATEDAIRKIVSGLPYGTHTVKFEYDSGSLAGDFALSDFIIYGPKKPSIPADAQEISDYYLMADFDASTAQTNSDAALASEVPQGVLGKMNVREFVYLGTPSINLNSNYRSGWRLDLDASGDIMEYTFFGTGFQLNLPQTGGGNTQASVKIDGVLDASGVVEFGGSNDGGGLYTKTNAASQRITFTGLSLGVHTVTLEDNDGAGTTYSNGIDIITPIHFPNTKAGSLSMGPGVQLQKETSTGGVDLGKAKVLLAYNRITSEILFSKNVAAVINEGTGDQIIHFEKPMKGEYVAAISSAEGQAFNLDTIGQRTPDRIVTRTTGSTGTVFNTEYLSVAIFGELQDEEEE